MCLRGEQPSLTGWTGSLRLCIGEKHTVCDMYDAPRWRRPRRGHPTPPPLPLAQASRPADRGRPPHSAAAGVTGRRVATGGAVASGRRVSTGGAADRHVAIGRRATAGRRVAADCAVAAGGGRGVADAVGAASGRRGPTGGPVTIVTRGLLGTGHGATGAAGRRVVTGGSTGGRVVAGVSRGAAPPPTAHPSAVTGVAGATVSVTAVDVPVGGAVVGMRLPPSAMSTTPPFAPGGAVTASTAASSSATSARSISPADRPLAAR